MRFQRSAITAYIAATAVMLLGAAGFRLAVEQLNVFVVKKPVPLRGALATIPPTLGRWERVGEDGQFSSALVEELGTAQYMDRTYAIDGDPDQGIASVHVAYYTGAIDDVPHIPERCWDAAGMRMTRPPERLALEIDASQWQAEEGTVNRATGETYRGIAVRHPITGLEETVYMPIGPFEMTVTEFSPSDNSKLRQTGGYFFIANGRTTPNALGVRTLAFSLTDEFAYYCKVQVTTSGSASDDVSLEEYRATASELVEELLPHLMKRLPRWPDYERGPKSAEMRTDEE